MAKSEIINNDAVTVRVNKAPAKVAKKAVDKTVDTAEHVIGETLDTIEQTLDILEDGVQVTERAFRTHPAVVIGVAVVSAGVAGFVAWKVCEKRLASKYEAEMLEQIAEAKEFYRRLGKQDEFATPEQAVQALVPENVVASVNSYQGKDTAVRYDKPEDIPAPEPGEEAVQVQVVSPEAVNVFVEAAVDPAVWDLQHEIANRKPDEPYVISRAEFEENEEGHEQQTLQYYEGDDVLTDSRDQPIDATEYTVGDDNLVRFGHGSDDANVVYVRNERLDTDFEILRSTGHYQTEVLGQPIEAPAALRHAQTRRARRMLRESDE